MSSRAPDITERPYIDLTGRQGVYYDPTTNAFDCAIAGMPFIMAVTDNTPYKRQTAEFRSQRIDQLRDPGEHTLSGSGYWIRSQSSFHYGEGILFSEPLQGNMDEVKFRYRDGYGVDPWTPGQLTLLRKTTNVKAMRGKTTLATGNNAANNIIIAVDEEPVVATTTTASAASGSTVISVASTSNIVVGYKVFAETHIISGQTVSSIGTGTVTLSAGTGAGTMASGTAITFMPEFAMFKIALDSTVTNFVTYASLGYKQILGQTSDGQTLYVATSEKVYDINLTTGTVSLDYTWNSGTPADVKLKYVKSRVIAAVLYTDGTAESFELTFPHKGTGTTINVSTLTAISGSTTLPTNWVWTGITEGAGAIYLGGYAGEHSTIFKLAVDSTGALSTLVTVVTLPRGEYLTALYCYLGDYLAIGTNKGVRIGTTDTNGNIAYGPLTFVTTNEVLDFEARNEFLYCTATAAINTQSGLYRINLGQPITLSGYAQPVATGNYARAADVFAADSTATVQSVRIYSQTDRKVFSINGVGVYVEHATDLVPQGQIRFARIRYDTLENKAWKRIRIRTPKEVVGEVEIYRIGETSDEIITTIHEGDSSEYDFDLSSVFNEATQDAAFKLVLYPNTTDATTSTIINGISIKALPTPTRARVLQIPVFLYDKETDKTGNFVGFEGYAKQRLDMLEEIEAQGQTVIFQDFTSGGSPIEVAIEQVTFTRSTPSARNYTGFGGIVNIIARTIV